MIVDGASVGISILTLWITVLMSLSIPVLNQNIMNNLFSILLSCLILFFSTTNFVTFFVLFELSLIPTLALILGWGMQPERLEASHYFFFYTVSFSIPLLVSLLLISKYSESVHFFPAPAVSPYNGVVGTFLLLVFLINLPLFCCHIWLPKAHVEAPVAGSMVLAGILLKTGGYGIVRFYEFILSGAVNCAFMSLASVGIVLVCLSCIYGSDINQIIAYSSVSHINFLIMGLFWGTASGFAGGVLLIVSHGLSSSLIFYLADLLYKRSGSRSLIVNNSSLIAFPKLGCWWSMATLINMGIPPSLGSLGELVIIAASLAWSLAVPIALYLFLSALYSVNLYTSLTHGSAIERVSAAAPTSREELTSMGHVAPLLGLMLLTPLLWI